MGTVSNLADYRATKAAPPQIAPIKRTPELALLMALFDQLPRKYTGLALTRVMQMADAAPNCPASQEAGRIAALIGLTRGAKR